MNYLSDEFVRWKFLFQIPENKFFICFVCFGNKIIGLFLLDNFVHRYRISYFLPGLNRANCGDFEFLYVFAVSIG